MAKTIPFLPQRVLILYFESLETLTEPFKANGLYQFSHDTLTTDIAARYFRNQILNCVEKWTNLDVLNGTIWRYD